MWEGGGRGDGRGGGGKGEVGGEGVGDRVHLFLMRLQRGEPAARRLGANITVISFDSSGNIMFSMVTVEKGIAVEHKPNNLVVQDSISQILRFYSQTKTLADPQEYCCLIYLTCIGTILKMFKLLIQQDITVE